MATGLYAISTGSRFGPSFILSDRRYVDIHVRVTESMLVCNADYDLMPAIDAPYEVVHSTIYLYMYV